MDRIFKEAREGKGDGGGDEEEEAAAPATERKRAGGVSGEDGDVEDLDEMLRQEL